MLSHRRDRGSNCFAAAKRDEKLLASPRDTQLGEDAHLCRAINGVPIMATLRSLVTNALRLGGFCSITEALAALIHDIKG
ncbi:MAG: hypothetical protein ACK5N0_00875 [Synechococcaceae cyanobacterium]